MKILVLGGTGAMGADLVKILATRGENVTVTSRSSHRSEFSNVKYVQGDGHDITFLQDLLKRHYDVIVDFMVYRTKEFNERLDLLLNGTEQYIFLSSSRVYADSKTLITEESPRLLDVAIDQEYLKTDEYALSKARQENMLRDSGKTNWTIIRPYITYNNQRLQFGVYEKELWLYSAIHDHTILFVQQIADHYTTLTYGMDVAFCISKLIDNSKALGQTFHITTDQAIKWIDVLDIYQKVFMDAMGKEIKVQYTDNPKPIYELFGNKYQVIYDRMFDRRFDNSKILETVDKIEFTSPQEGLERCLREFLCKPKYKYIPNLSYMDKLSREKTNMAEIPGLKQKIKYLVIRYLPNNVIEDLRKYIR